MSLINTQDQYVKEYCKTHPDLELAFTELRKIQKSHLVRYGVPEKGGYEDVFYDVNATDWFKKVKATQVDLLRELKRVCDANGLTIYLVYGSLLGAVRSGGMIAADDDIDVALMRDDYDKLVQLTSEFKAPYFLQNNYNDDCFYGGYIKFRNADTTAINPQNWYVNCCEGIFIDVFPIDTCYTSKVKEFFKLQKIHHLQRLLYAKSYGFFSSFKDMPLLVWKLYKYVGKLFSRQALLGQLDRAFRANDNSSKKLAIYTHYGTKAAVRYMDRSAFEEVCTMTYEGMEFTAPKGWDELLYSFYGANYLVPNTVQNNFHGFYKPDVPYKNYKKRFTSLFTSRPDKNKDLLFVGDKKLLKEYKKRFSHSDYTPKNFLGTQDLDALKEYPVESTHIVIGAFDFLTVEDAVRALGFRDYSIYIYNRDWLSLPNIRSSKTKYMIEKVHKNK
ncbi:MAG: LicD family protein [Treponema sp.]|nr:LicD family protein [Treponema sp.]